MPDDLLQQWKQIAGELNETKVAAVDRMLKTNESFVLNLFSDASMDAYGAAAYISDGEVSKLLFARGRVAPIKKITIPQLDLTALTLAVRVSLYILETFSNALNFKGVNIWSDSMTSLAWINSDKKSPVFVQNRVKEIVKN